MEKEQTLTEQESLAVISKMIKTAQNELEDDSFYYLIWGWLVFIASVGNFVLMKMESELAFLPWAVLMPLGGVLTFIYSGKHEKKQKVRTYTEEVMKYVVIAFLVTLFITLSFMSKLGLSTYPIVLLIYGIWLFVSGGAIKFTPLIIGGIINWAAAIAAFFVTFDFQLLILAIAVLLGYIIPGHLLKARFSAQKASN